MTFHRAAILALFAAVTLLLSTTSFAETVVVRVGKLLDVEQGVYLADRAIRKGEELTADYRTFVDEALPFTPARTRAARKPKPARR